MGIQTFGPSKVTNRTVAFTGVTNKTLGNSAGWHKISKATYDGNSQDTTGSLYVNNTLVANTSLPTAPVMLNLPANATIDYYPTMSSTYMTGTSANITAGAYGNGLYMLSASGGYVTPTYNCIILSTDGNTWFSKKGGPTFTTNAYSNAVAYGNGYYVAVSGSGAIAASTDLITWTTRTSGTTANLNGITYANGLFVVSTGTATLVLYSSDSITWSQAAVTSGAATYAPVYGNNGWLLAGQSIRILNYSTNGTTWSAYTDTAFTTSYYINDITYGNGVYLIAVGINGIVRRSTSPSSGWASVDAKMTSSGGVNSVVYCGGTRFLASSAYTGYPVSTSDDNGVTWTLRTLPQSAYKFASMNGMIYGVNSGSTTLASVPTSTDGITWTVKLAPNMRVAPGPSGSYAGIGGNNASNVFVSSDGVELATIGPDPGGSSNRLVFGNGLFVSDAGNVGLFTSTDGTKWTLRKNTANSLGSLSYYNNKYYAGFNGGEISISTDGITWSSYAAGTSIRGIAASPSKTIAVKSSGNSVFVSTDDITWATVTGPSSTGYDGIVYGNNTFVTVKSNIAYSSTDGVTWTGNGIGGTPTASGSAIFFLNNSFIIPLTNGGIAISSDGISWKIVPSTNSTYAVSTPIYINNSLKVYGNNGVISYDNPTPTKAYAFVSNYGAEETLV